MGARGRVGPVDAAQRWLGATLARRMGAAAVGVTLLALAAAGGTAYAVTRELIRRNQEQRLDAEAQLAAQALHHALAGEIADLRELAGSPLLATALLDSTGRDQYAEPYLRSHTSRGGVAVSLCDYRGRPVTVAGAGAPLSVEGAPWLREVVEDGRPRAELGDGGRIRVVLPVDDPDTAGAEGVLVAEIDPGGTLAEAARRLPPELSVAVAAGAGEPVIRAGPSAPRAGETAVVERIVALELPPPVDRLGLELRVEAPEAIAAPPGWLGLAWAAGCVALLGVALVVARRAADRITRPLRALEATAARIAEAGSFGVRVPDAGADEVARLGRTFNRMLEGLERVSEADRATIRARQLQAESALRVALLAVENASEAMTVVDRDGRVVFANPAAGPLLGVDAGAALGRLAWEVVPGLDEAAWRRRWEEVRARGVVVAEHDAPRAGLGVRHLESTARHLQGGEEEFIVTTTRDVTERRQADGALRLAGVGTLAAGVAHEINNPLTYVLGNLGFVRSSLERLGGAAADGLAAEAREAIQAVDEAQLGAERVRGIVQALRTFARPAARTREPVDVRAAVDTAAVLVRNEVRHRARLVVDSGPAPVVVASRQRLEQVILNLLVNAAQAIPEGAAERNTIWVRVRGTPATAVVEVQDTGEGMTPEVRARIFEPFFTTKPVGSGTGLGLSICHGIVAEAGGRIEVESERGRGSTFRVILPVDGEAGPRDAVGPAPR